MVSFEESHDIPPLAPLSTRAAPPLPPGPSGFLVPFARFVLDPHAFFPWCIDRWGDPFFLALPGTPGTVVTGDPEGIGAIMTADPDTFTSFRMEAIEQQLGKHSLYFQSGAAHKAARRLLGPAFHASRAAVHGDVFADITLRRTAHLRRGSVFDLHRLAQWISLEVVTRAILGVREEAHLAAFHDAIVEGLSISPAVLYFSWLRHEYGGFGPWAKARRLYHQLMRLLREHVARRKVQVEPGDDVLGMMLAARYADGTPMSDEEVCDKLYDILIAGYETTAVALTWAGYEICRNPAVLRRLTDELLASPGDPTSLGRIAYLEAICSETLRRYPNFVLLTRHLARPFRLKGVDVPAGLNVSAAIGAAHFREQAFPRPRSFEPERFLDRTYSPFEYLPFGGGVQRCLGAPFAMHEMKVVLGTLFRRYRLALRSRRPLRAFPRVVTVGPRGRCDMVVVDVRE